MRGEPVFAQPKDPRGTLKREKLRKTLAREAREDAEKAKVRRRDPRCRWPHLTTEEKELCRRSRAEVHHVFAKGMGGDHGNRTDADIMIRVCDDVHQGPLSFHQKNRRVVFLQPDKKCRGQLAFEEKRGGKWIVVAIEMGVGVLKK